MYDSPYHGDYAMCGDLWMSEDGLRIFTRCGNVFRSSPNRYSSGTTPEDMTYNGALENLSSVRHLCHSQTIGKVAAIPDITYSNANADTEIRTFNYDFLTFQSSVTLPYFVVSNTSAFSGHGRYVFYNSNGTRVLSYSRPMQPRECCTTMEWLPTEKIIKTITIISLDPPCLTSGRVFYLSYGCLKNF
jgi:hypothetical protein